MELSSEMILDIALNAAGYLAAGILSVTIYSIFIGRRRQKKQLAPVSIPVSPDATSGQADSGHSQFIDLKGTPVSRTSLKKSTTTPQGQATISRADRAGVIRIARGMLKAGATSEKIQQVLPISNAELTLLSYQEQ